MSEKEEKTRKRWKKFPWHWLFMFFRSRLKAGKFCGMTARFMRKGRFGNRKKGKRGKLRICGGDVRRWRLCRKLKSNQFWKFPETSKVPRNRDVIPTPIAYQKFPSSFFSSSVPAANQRSLFSSAYAWSMRLPPKEFIIPRKASSSSLLHDELD